MNDIVLAIVLIIVVVLVAVAVRLFTRLQYERRFRRWQREVEERLAAETETARRQAVSQSRAVLGGKFTEQLAPFLPGFRYDPTEARFIGSPVDFLVFPGLAGGEPEEIVILEVKSGRSAALTREQRRIQQLVEDGMVRFELLRRDAEGTA